MVLMFKPPEYNPEVDDEFPVPDVFSSCFNNVNAKMFAKRNIRNSKYLMCVSEAAFSYVRSYF